MSAGNRAAMGHKCSRLREDRIDTAEPPEILLHLRIGSSDDCQKSGGFYF